MNPEQTKLFEVFGIDKQDLAKDFGDHIYLWVCFVTKRSTEPNLINERMQELFENQLDFTKTKIIGYNNNSRKRIDQLQPIIKLDCFQTITGKPLSWERKTMADEDADRKEKLQKIDQELKIIEENETWIKTQQRLKLAQETSNGINILEAAFYRGDIAVNEWEWFCSQMEKAVKRNMLDHLTKINNVKDLLQYQIEQKLSATEGNQAFVWWQRFHLSKVDYYELNPQTIDDLINRGIVDINNFDKIEKFKNFAQSNKAELLYRNKIYVHKKIIILIGEPGTGKSSLAQQLMQGLVYRKIGGYNSKWMDKFNPLKDRCILIEEIDFNEESGNQILIWGDIYPFYGEIKGGSVFVNVPWIILTANAKNVKDLVKNCKTLQGEQPIQALQRRSIIEVVAKNDDISSLAKRLIPRLKQSYQDGLVKASAFKLDNKQLEEDLKISKIAPEEMEADPSRVIRTVMNGWSKGIKFCEQEEINYPVQDQQ